MSIMLFRFIHSKLQPYIFKVYSRMKTFERMVAKARSAASLGERMTLAQNAAWFAVCKPTGFYASPELEQIYLDAASQIPSVTCATEKNTVLHVMTQASRSGGHTRVVQRWIDLSNKDERHDIIILNQEDLPIPQWLEDAVVGHCGSIRCLHEEDLLKQASQLRQYASTYERIILHVHMADPTAIVAFGSESFTTPIIFFNHADHLFWLGVSIADMVADLRCDHISYTRRVASKSYTLGIPCAPLDINAMGDKISIRRELGIPENDYVLVTTASAHKFKPIGNNSLCRQLVDIVQAEPNVSYYAIGPDLNTEHWQWAHDESKGKIHPLGVVQNYELYQKYLLAADLYVGSYPYGSYTSTMDAVQCGLPFVQRLTNREQKFFLSLSPDLDQSLNLCYSGKGLVNRVREIMHDKEGYELLLNTSRQWLEEYSNREQWRKRLYDMYAQCPKQHAIHSFEIKKGKQVIIDDDACLIGLLYEKNAFEIQNPLLRRMAYAWLRMMGV